jgi:hypothetical protein
MLSSKLFPAHLDMSFFSVIMIIIQLNFSIQFNNNNNNNNNNTNNSNFVALVCERTIPTERPPLVSEVSDNFCG